MKRRDVIKRLEAAGFRKCRDHRVSAAGLSLSKVLQDALLQRFS